MKKMMNNATRVLGVLFLITMLLASVAQADVLKGRDYVRLGKLHTISGSLSSEQDEWTLKVEDTVYELHLGPSAYWQSKGLVLKKGLEATVTGFVFKNHVAVTEISTGGKILQIRDRTGRPTWGGSKNARGRNRMSTAPSNIPGHDHNHDSIPKL